MLREQDRINIEFIREVVKKRPDIQKSLEGPIKWVGEEGFNECVAHLSKKKGITNAKALCGYLKHEARKTRNLKPKHMGRKEKAAYLSKKRTKK
jgi:hypothetical protein